MYLGMHVMYICRCELGNLMHRTMMVIYSAGKLVDFTNYLFIQYDTPTLDT